MNLTSEQLQQSPKCKQIYKIGDCLELMKEIPDKSIDLVLTDPPYNASNSNICFEEKGFKAVNEKWDKGFTLDYISECYRVLKTNGSLLTFCSHHLLGETIIELKKYLKLQQIIHWIKTNPFPAIAKVYTPNVEYVCWGVKGSPYIFNKQFSGQNIIKTNIVFGADKTEHPTTKPLELIKQLVFVHSNEGDTVLDPFLGSGTTLRACRETNRNGIGFEINPEYEPIIRKRLMADIPPLEAFF